MKILVENGCYELRNMGDVAMLQVAVKRLHDLWPDALIKVITSEPELLSKYCPRAHPITAEGRHIWFQDRNILGDFYRYIPDRMAGYFLRSGQWIRCRQPNLTHKLIKFKAGLRGVDIKQMSDFLEALFGADLVVVSGGGDINDSFLDYAMTVLGLLEMSSRYGITTAIFGQGIGPIENSRLRERAKEVLHAVNIIAIREGHVALPLLELLGVERERIIVTGDDAIELAFGERHEKLGKAIGVNFRVAHYSEVTKEHIKIIGSVLRDCATRYGSNLVPLPISFYEEESDVKTIQQVLRECDVKSSDGQNLNSPVKVAKQVSRCRIVVTGSYHSAVFALSQGIPAVCLVKSAYYRDKFLGLANQFGCGCEMVFLDEKGMSVRLVAGIETVWNLADELRAQLLEAAERQIALGKTAYSRVYELVESRKVTKRPKREQFEHV